MKEIRYATKEEVVEALMAAYGSFESPNYRKISQQRESSPITTTVARLIRHSAYEDVSDENYDVCLILNAIDSVTPHVLYLSLIANFVYLSPSDFFTHTSLSHVISLLTEMEWSFIKRDLLLSPAPFSTDLAGDQAIIFNVVFSDTYTHSI